MAKETTKSVFETLNKVDCSKHVEKKQGLTYLSWAWAWQIVKGMYPDACYVRREWDGKPYLYDENLGYYVETSVTIGGETISMSLPVMDGANKAQKAHDYSYTVRDREGRPVEKLVKAATMFDINTALMRCLVKNLAMFGLGLYIYAGEDLPQEAQELREAEKKAEQERINAERAAAQQRMMEMLQVAMQELEGCRLSDEVKNVWNKYDELHGNTAFKAAVGKLGKQLKEQENGNA